MLSVQVGFGRLGRHVAARVICLILLPIILYLALFAVHLTVLNR